MNYLRFLKNEPVVILDVVKAAVAVVLLFGLHLPVGFAAAATALVVALLTLVTRAKVVPVPAPEDAPTAEATP